MTYNSIVYDSFTLRDTTLVLIGHAWSTIDCQATDVPWDLRAISQQLDRMLALARSYGGETHSLAGSYALVDFPCVTGCEQHGTACMAIQTALKMQSLAGVIGNNELESPNGCGRPGIAVCSGRAYLGMRFDRARDVPVIMGCTVDRAFGIHALAAPGKVLCDSTTWQLATGHLEPRREARQLVTRWGAAEPIYEIASTCTESAMNTPPGHEKRIAANGIATSKPTVVRRRGDIWTIDRADGALHLADSKGINYLIYLLAQPHRAVPAVELVSLLHQATRATAPHSAVPNVVDFAALGDTGPILDSQAKAEYRKRMLLLTAEVQEATHTGDLNRAARATEEKHMIARELRAAVGLGGRDRRGGSFTERARINVTRALRTAIGKIASQNPILGGHLNSSIRTGAFCSYSPLPNCDEQWLLA